MKKLACIFNYPPDYRKSIYKKIDETFDTQFFFGNETFKNIAEGIPKIDYSIFRKSPKTIQNKAILGNLCWRTGIQLLPYSGYDIFLITGDAALSYFPFLLSCKLMRKKVYGWGHGFKKLSGVKGILGRIYMRLLTGYFTYSNHGRERMAKLGINQEKLPVIYNSLSPRIKKLPEFECSIFRDHFRNSLPTLIFIGRLTKSKRIDKLIDVLSCHTKKGTFYNLVIIGDGAEMVNLKVLASEKGVEDRIWFFGACHDDGVIAPMLYNADLCVSPGNVGLTALSSLQYGTPVISHDSFYYQGPEYEVIIPDKTGALYRYGDYNDMADKIEDWLSKIHDRHKIRMYCLDVINGVWNSDYQIELIDKIFSEKV